MISTAVVEKGSPDTPIRAPFPGFCWQLALMMVMTGSGVLDRFKSELEREGAYN